MIYPLEYDSKSYIIWHEDKVDKNFVNKLSDFKNKLKNDSLERIEKFNDLLSIIGRHINDDRYINEKKELGIEVLLYNPVRPELMFKSQESIINKLWRKNKDIVDSNQKNFIGIDNIKSEIKDLIRGSVIIPTFSYAKDFVKKLEGESWKKLLKIKEIDLEDYKNILKINIEEESKMEKGYFAYHIDVEYIDGIHIEVQIFSKLTEVWRNLSHKIYEESRIKGKIDYRYGTVQARLISLGHLLHLAECEIQYLLKEIE